MLEDVIYRAAVWGRNVEEVDELIELLMESYQGKNRRLQLHKQFSDQPFEKDVAETGNINFVKNWEKITLLRNKRLHGTENSKDSLSRNLIISTINDGLDAFQQISNKYTRHDHEYKHPFDYRTEVDNKELFASLLENMTQKAAIPSERDLKKWGKWRERVLSSGYKLYIPPKNNKK